MTLPTPDPNKKGREPEPDGSKADGSKANGTAPDGTAPDGAKANGAKANGTKANGAAEPASSIPDPFDPEAFRLPPEGEPGSGVEVQPVKLKVRKPKRTEYFRCHPELRMMAAVLEKEDGFDKIYYLAVPAVAAMNAGELRTVELCLCVNRDGTLFVWPIPQPSESGKSNDWGVTAREGAHKALAKWTRLKSDKANSQYNVITSEVYNQAPAWPQPPMTLKVMLDRTFDADHRMLDEDHHELKALRGE